VKITLNKYWPTHCQRFCSFQKFPSKKILHELMLQILKLRNPLS
jgi:hypothetical protein